MNKNYSVVSKTGLLACLMGVILAGTAFGQTNVGSFTPSTFEVTFTKFELVLASGTSVTVYDTPTTVDIADAADVGTVLQTLADKTFPAGSYTKFRVTISQNMIIAGTKNISGVDYVTDGALNAGGAPTMSVGGSGTEVETAIVIPGGDVVHEYDLTGAPVTISEGQNLGTVSVKVDLANVCNAWSLAGLFWMVPSAPSVTVTGL